MDSAFSNQCFVVHCLFKCTFYFSQGSDDQEKEGGEKMEPKIASINIMSVSMGASNSIFQEKSSFSPCRCTNTLKVTQITDEFLTKVVIHLTRSLAK